MAGTQTSGANALTQLAGVAENPFVSVSPLIVAVVCSDGVALVAVHTAFTKEPLLLDEENDGSQIDDQRFLRDLPRAYRGPFRIYSVDRFGTGLVCAGWRADSQILVDFCRSLASEEYTIFGTPRTSVEYGQYLASETSLWMAQCAVSERVRAFSCVGLLASCGPKECPGYLWLIDTTGAYRVRALAVGGGDLSATINERLEKMPLHGCRFEVATLQVLRLLAELELPSESRVEVAFVSSAKRKLLRKLSSYIFAS